MSAVTGRSRSVPPSYQAHGASERFERQAGPRRGWTGGKNDPPTGNINRCWKKICTVQERRDPKGNFIGYLFTNVGNSLIQSGYDFAADTTNYTRNAVGGFLSSPYGAAALDYSFGNHSGTPYNQTGASPAGLTNLTANTLRAGSTGWSPAELALLIGGAATLPVLTYVGYRTHQYATKPGSRQEPPIAEAVPLNTMPVTRV
jgi:hypothetical protein